jgi:phosphotransferase family enzyme
VRRHDEQWLAYFAAEGYRAAEPLGAGMEGAVFKLDGDLVAKVWGERPAGQLRRLGSFYAYLDSAGLPFLTPLFHEVREVSGRAVTVERRLPGVPLDDSRFARPGAWPGALSCVVSVLEAFTAVPGTPQLRALPVLDEDTAPWAGRDRWPQALSDLVTRRAEQSGALLHRSVPDFDGKLGKLLRGLAATGETMTALAHGDLIPGNILVDDNLHPLAVLDFGFLSTAADPAFDAAVTASVYDMYSPAARETERRIDEALISRFGYNPRRLALYRAAYAVITSTAYDPSGRDGHYKWCVDMLSRDSVVQALDAAPEDV